MITLGFNCLLFETADGESIPFSADMIAVEVTDEAAQYFDPDFVGHATSAVFHYFKHELGRESVTMAEFAGALEKVLDGFVPGKGQPSTAKVNQAEADLNLLAQESGSGCDLFFFPRLRGEVRGHVRAGASVLRFRGLRSCVKHLCGARRWTGRCQTVKEQILSYLNNCLSAETACARPEGSTPLPSLCLVVE